MKRTWHRNRFATEIRARPRPLRFESLESRTLLAALPLAETIYFSTAAPGSVTGSDGVQGKFDDSDIVRLDLERNEAGAALSYRYEMLFDGSDVGLDSDGEDIDALTILPDGSFVISTTGKATVPGLTADDEDLLLFTPAPNGLGFHTAGAWTLLFDGSDVGLGSDSEDVDAVALLPDGRLLISTVGAVSVTGVKGSGEDLLAFQPAAGGLGPQTAGTWAMFFDGSQHGLTASGEKIDALDIQDGTILNLSTNGSVNVGTAAGDNEDVFSYDTVTGSYLPGLRLDGSQIGLAGANIDAVIFAAPGGPAPEPAVGLPVVDVTGIWAAAQTKLAAHDARNAIKTRYANDASASSTAWTTVGPSNWVSGFYPGMLWQMYEATGDPAWLTRAQSWTAGIEGQKNNTAMHDLGFMVLDSFGQGARLTGDAHYQDVVLAAARSLSSRYNSTVGALRSWDGGGFKVIIDSLVNIELLFNAAKHGGTTAKGGSAQDLYNMAVRHALKVLQNNVRADGSTYHLVNYSTSTGNAVSKSTAGGKSTETTWARGQAWAVYGFTTTFRETGDATFLEAARKTADFFIDHLPDDSVPAADFSSAFTDLAHKDSSAAAIAASGLIELSSLETDPTRSQHYWDAGVKILDSLTSAPYFSAGSDHAGLLLHGARGYPGNNVSLIFGDYYLIEATLRYAQVIQSQQQPEPPAST